MNISARVGDERVADVRCDAERLIVDLADGRTIAVPLAWYPRLLNATPAQRATGPGREAASASTGPTWTRISASPACCAARPRPS